MKNIVSIFDTERLLIIAVSLYENKEIDKAKAMFLRILEKEPLQFESNFYLAAIYEVEENFTEAINCFEKLVKIKYWDKELKDFLLELYIKNSDYLKALKLVRALIFKYHDNQVYWLKLADILYLTKRYRKALKILEKLYTLNGEKEILSFKLMLCYREIKRWEEALSNGEKLLTYNANNPIYHYFIGSIYERMQEYSQSYRAYYNAYKLARKSPNKDSEFYKDLYKKISQLNLSLVNTYNVN